MATTRPFAYNTGTAIPGTHQFGNLAVGIPTSGFTSTGLDWWNGPDEDLGFVIAQEAPILQQPTPVNHRWNSNYKGSNTSLSGDDATVTNIANNFVSVISTRMVSSPEKVVFTVKLNSNITVGYIGFGLANMDINSYVGTNDGRSIGFGSDGKYYYYGAVQDSGLPTWGSENDVIDVAINLLHNKIFIRVNGGNWNGVRNEDPSSGAGSVGTAGLNNLYPCLTIYSTVSPVSATLQASSTYGGMENSIPSGYTFFGNIYASVGFFRTSTFNDAEFISLTEIMTGYQAGNPLDAYNYLITNGYWTSWQSPGDLIMFISGTSISGSTMQDFTAFNNDATLIGGFTHSFYNDTKVLRLNGSNSFIQSTDFSALLDDKFTYETWVLAGTTSNGTIIAEWSGPAPTGWCDAQSGFVNGSINVGVYSGGYIQGPTFVKDYWYNITTVYTGSELKLYVNGDFINSQSITKLSPGTLHLTLGRDDVANSYIGGASGYLNGYVGHWKIYDYDLSSLDISSQYVYYRNIYDNSLVVNLDASKTASYPGTGNLWTDLSLKNNHGTITNAVYVPTSGGTFNFDGSGDYVLIGQPIPSLSDYSISAWVYANDVSGSHNIVSSQDSPFWVASGTLYAGVGGNYFAVSSASFPTGTWKFVSMTFKDSTNTMKLYINGALVNTNTNVTESYTPQNTYIGSHYFGSPVSFWNGYIAQVNIYKSEQTSGQILDTYNKTKSRFGL